MRRAAVAVIGLGCAYAVLQALGRGAGSTHNERVADLPGDDLVVGPQVRTDHATTIDATPDEVWPWLTQMGWHRGGWYTPRWVDRLLFPDNWASLDRLDPSLVRELEVGDTIPDGKPGTAHYVVVQVESPHALVLRSDTHVPPGWSTRYGVALDWTWCMRLTPVGDGRTRVHLRVRGRGRPWWFIALYQVVIVPADYVMAMGMLRGLARRVEARAAPAPSGRARLTSSG